MAKHHYGYLGERPWYVRLFKALGITLLTLVVIGAIFCFTVLIYGGCTNQTFIEVLKAWFTPKTTPAEPTQAETAVSVANIMFGL